MAMAQVQQDLRVDRSADSTSGYSPMDSLESMVNALVGWLEGILDDIGWDITHELPTDVLLLTQSLALAPGTAVSPASGELMQLVLCAIDLHPVSWLALGIMLFGSQLIASRAQRYQLPGRELAMNASRVLLVSSAVQAAVCGLDYAQVMQPLALSLRLSSPFLVGRFLQDALILPYWVTSIGRAMGSQEAQRAYSCAGLGNLFQIAAVWCDVWDLSKWFLMPAALCIGMASHRVLQYDQGTEAAIPSKNRSDMQSSGYLLVFYMLSGFIIEVLGLSHEIGEEQMLLEYAVVDVLGKVPSCHLFTRSLSGSQSLLGHTNTRGRLDIAAIDFEDDDED